MTDDLSDIKVDVAEIKTHVLYMREKLENGEARFFVHNRRISSLERWRSYLAGLGTFITLMLYVLWEKIRRFG
jgi:hypothetical protein